MSGDLAQNARAEMFLALHRRNRPFVLGNCWDVVTALLLAREGFEAIGTSSYATAASLGWRDGRQVLLKETADLVERLTRRLDLPVNADIEAGHSETVYGVARSARAVLDAGAVGINIEDATGDPDRPLHEISFQQEKIAALREEIGVVRVSLGPTVMRAGLGSCREIAREILDRGTFTRLTAGALSYEETNRLLAGSEQ